MNDTAKLPLAGTVLPGGSLPGWRAAQIAVLTIGLGIFVALLFLPEVGHHALWNVLITAAPALFILAPGLWRNVCPMASVAMLPHHFDFSRQHRLPPSWQDRLSLAGVALLLLLVPARHVLLDPHPQATGWTLAALGVAAFIAGFLFDSKSGWCNSLCPVLPVEKLYGQKSWITVENAHCGECRNCTRPCPDSASGLSLAPTSARVSRRIWVSLVVGGFPGFVWGWFQVPVYRDGVGARELAVAFGLPWGMLLLSLAIFLLLRGILGSRKEPLLAGVFAAAAVSCYYWYRLPALIGFGLFPRDGLLVDLTRIVPTWSVLAAQIASAAFFFWWLVIRRRPPVAWAHRPPYAATELPEPCPPAPEPGRDIRCNDPRQSGVRLS